MTLRSILCWFGIHRSVYYYSNEFRCWKCERCGRSAVYRRNISPVGWYETDEPCREGNWPRLPPQGGSSTAKETPCPST